ncbi:MAG: hypothetical protein KatS3mg019_2019 [Fimbriimonadales bacterium]|nr:MAG: hypothetical protein KatS3mg019_2019 [Fimbriimonadales bacterium]
MNIGAKVALYGIAGVSVLCVALLLTASRQTKAFAQIATEQIETQINNDLSHIAELTYDMVESQDQLLRKTVGHALDTAWYIMKQSGGYRWSDDTISWKAINQFTKEEQTVQLPKVMIGSRWLGQERDLKRAVPVVDQAGKLTDSTVTIFQRMNEQGDMLRVATNVPTKDNTRAIGTYIPAVNPDGKPNPVVSKVLKGERFIGVAFVVNAWYVAAYDPIFDSKGRVIGVLYSGVRQESVDTVRQSIDNLKVGETGGVFVLGAKGDQKGKLIIAEEPSQNSAMILDAKDAANNAYVQTIVEKVQHLKPGETFQIRYQEPSQNGGAPRTRRLTVAYYAPWDWAICVGAYEDEYLQAIGALDAAREQTIRSFLAIGALITLLVAIGLFFAGRSIARPMQQLANVSNAIAQGDLTQEIQHKSNDETGRLADAFRQMTQYLRRMSSSAGAIAQGDLSVQVEPASPRDEFGNAFQQMVNYLRRMASSAEAIAQGDLSVQVEPASPRDEFGNAFQQMVNYLRTIEQSANRVAQGDLTCEIRPVSERDQLGNALSGMLLSLRTIVGQLSRTSQELAATSQQLTATTRQSAQHAQTVAHHSEVMASSTEQAAYAMDALNQNLQALQRSSEQQRQMAQEAAAAMNHSAQSIEEIALASQQVASASQEAAAVAHEGGYAVQEVIRSMQRMQERTTSTAERVQLLDQYSQQIGVIVQAIREIAQQTNLLALNAAIEAARAGEHGKGFAVVADEVRRLAAQAGNSAQEIGRIIGEICGSVEQVVNAMEQTRTEVQQGYARSTEAETALNAILEAVNSVAHEVQGISNSTQQVSASVQQVLASILETRNTSEQNAQAAQTMAQNSEQVATTIGAVAHTTSETIAYTQEIQTSAQQAAYAAEQLSATASQLQQIVNRFKLRESQQGARQAA